MLDTSITAIDERGPVYRGHAAVELGASGACFEAVAELLWTGQLSPSPPLWDALAIPSTALGAPCSSLDQLWLRFPVLGQATGAWQSRAPEVELEHGRKLIRSMAALLVPTVARAKTRRIAELVAHGARVPKSPAVSAVDLALVLLADHELNASSFAARVAASTDAPLSACMLAALCTLSGPRHGGACDRVEALLAEAETLAQPGDVVERRARRGDPIPGFGHPLYPAGDPRARPLLDCAQALARHGSSVERRVAPCFAVAELMDRQGLPATVDFALVALTRALGMKPGAAALLFALGRSAGWVAHVLEQRRSASVLRPRARYVGA